jgi:aquaporin Z
MRSALMGHWPEYLMEAAGLGFFMISACSVTVLIEHPGSPVRVALADAFLRRSLIGLAMGLTATGLIYSPWGKRSGAHFNPTVTLTYLRLGRVETWDAVFYVVAHFAGALAGVLVATVLLRGALAHAAVKYAVTRPGVWGRGGAFTAEFFISLGLMVVVLLVSNAPRIARFTGLCAGVVVALYIAIEAPLSGMSMNPARTLGSALPAWTWTGLWIYFTAPLLGMLTGAELYRGVSARSVACAKLHHQNSYRCIFRCRYRGQGA